MLGEGIRPLRQPPREPEARASASEAQPHRVVTPGGGPLALEDPESGQEFWRSWNRAKGLCSPHQDSRAGAKDGLQEVAWGTIKTHYSSANHR